MISYLRIACCFSFLPFLSPANSSFTPLSQTSSSPFLGQKCISSEKTTLLQLKRDLSAATPETSHQPSSGSLLTSWKPNTDCCSWEGVTCHEVTTHVIGLNLSGHNLSGLVNSINFLNLPYLERLNLVNCNLGEIPSFVEKLGGLVELDLSKNKIHGNVPKWLQFNRRIDSNSTNLYQLPLTCKEQAHWRDSIIVLQHEQSDNLGYFLETLNLYGNQLTGKIPESLTHCKRLQVLDLGDNQINATFPFWLGMLPQFACSYPTLK
ncbi:hypothetical protein OIU85_002732 [Salix viminalis]|uniref:Leucine-rich repeat-containing N-terminal plant-type domain-containing protein n=1 Tax=Salix viminalis TaxID=40686 RepID=A0A9Q0VNZ8_SALVM|nr:hypothetical protein OIU85_002732 [Salix viminalis]